MQQNSTNIPFWRDVRVLKVLFQILFLLGVFLLAGLLYSNMIMELRRQDLSLSIGFLTDEAGFDISEGIEYDPSDTYLKAFYVGVVNTIRVSLTGIVFATIIGLFFGISRLSSNWLVQKIAAVYIEIFRNVPLLLQILFWYGISGTLPDVRDSIQITDSIFINNRAIYFPLPQPTSGFNTWIWYLLVAVVLAAVLLFVLPLILRRMYLRNPEQTENQGNVINISSIAKWSAAPVFLLLVIAGWIFTPEGPFTLNRPEFQRFNFVGGSRITTNSLSLLIGLSVYTSAYIAEVVRSGIQAVTKGQREAARAVGLSAGQTLRLIVLPQAIPIIIPPLTSQYLNLAKNSSLATAVAYPDIFSIGKTIMIQAAKSIPVYAMIMLSYLTMSLTTSAAMNWYNSWINRIKR